MIRPVDCTVAKKVNCGGRPTYRRHASTVR
jgi:hypothetical protein